MKHWREVFLVGLLAMVLAITRQARLAAFTQHQDAQKYEDVYYLPQARWLPALSLGFQQALADVIWCRSLTYFGQELVQRRQVQYVFDYTDAILALDPSFRAAYRWIATAAIYRPSEVSLEQGLRATEYLKRATERWPDDGELRWDYGSQLRFELAPLERDKKRKRALLERAAPELEAAARLGAGPPWLAINNAELLNKLGRTDQAVRQLEELLSVTSSDDVKRDIEAQLYRLRGETYLVAAQLATEELERERVASYPYLPPTLFLLLGTKTVPSLYVTPRSSPVPDDLRCDEESACSLGTE